MRAHIGTSFEQSHSRWRRFDVDLEDSDLERMAIEHGFDPTRLRVKQAFMLLEVEAQILFYETMTARHQMMWATPDNLRTIEEFKELKDKLLSEIQNERPGT